MPLIAHWKLDGDYDNRVGNQITLTNPSGDGTSVDAVVGKGETKTTGYYLTNLNVIPNDLTISLWYRHNGTAWLSECIFGTRTGSNGFMFYRNDGDTDGYHRIYFWYVNTSGSVVGWNTWPGVSGLNADQWYHITLTRTYDGYIKVYVDGVQAYSGAPPGDFDHWHNNGANLAFHAQGNGSGYLDGNVSYDDIRVYDHALSAKEIKELAQGMIVHYDFNDYQEPTFNEFDYTALNSGSYGGYGTIQSGALDAFGTTDNPVYRKQGKIRFGYSNGTDVNTLYVNRTYTFSIYLRTVQTLANPAGMEFDICDRADSYGENGVPFGNITNSWKRFEVTALHNNASTYHFIDLGEYLGTGWFEWCCPQIEEKDHATPYVPPQTGRNAIVFDASGNDNHAFMAGEEDFVANLSSASATVIGNTVTKNTTTSSWDTGATSLQSFDSDCFVEWTMDYVSETEGNVGAEMVGLNSNHSTWSYTDIDYAWYIHGNGDLQVRENGTSMLTLTDEWDRSERNIFRIEVLNGKVYYYHNGTLKYTNSSASHTGELYVDMSLHSYGNPNVVKNIRCGYLPRGTITPDWIEGKIGGGYDWGTGDQANKKLKAYIPETTGDLTVNVWAYQTANGSNDNPMVTMSSDTSFLNGWALWNGYGTDMRFTVSGTQALANPLDGMYDSWHMYTGTYNVSTGDVKLWFDGQVVATAARTPGTPMVTANRFLAIGEQIRNANQSFSGMMSDVRVYGTELDSTAIAELYQTRASIDNGGSLQLRKLNEVGHKPLILDYTTWEAGQTGSVGVFGQNGATAENSRVLEADPWGKMVPVWEATPEAVSGADGGWNTSNFPIDNTKMYRFSTWIRRPELGNGSYYLGTYGKNAAGTNEGVLNRSNGSVNTNPYFKSASWPSNHVGDWCLLVGHVWPAGSGTGSARADSALYDLEGNIITTCGDFVWQSTNTQAIHRSYLYYSTSTDTRQQWVYPRVDVVDGSEPSIADLLSGFDSRNFDYIKAKGASGSLSLDVGDNETKTAEISELGPTRGLVGYYPLEGDTKDYADVNDGTAVNATVGARGYDFNGSTAYIDLGSDIIYSPDTQGWSFSCFFKTSTPATIQAFLSAEGDEENSNWLNLNGSKIAIWDRTQSVWKYGSTTITADTWYHVTYVCKPGGTSYQFYVNGVAESGDHTSFTFTASNSTLQARYIGRYEYAGSYARYWNGSISDVRFYDRDLSDAEVALLYDITNPTSINRVKKTSDNVYVKTQVREV